MIREWTADDYPEIAQWFKERQMPAPLPSDLPVDGFIEPGVAAGFLVRTNTTTAILDAFISNPGGHEKQRKAALHEIAVELIGRAHVLGFRHVRAFSRIDTIEKRLSSLGFTKVCEANAYAKEI